MEPPDDWMERREGLLVCRVCGLRYDDPPWGAKLVHEYCDCCGVQFSYGDATLAGIRAWREDWLAQGGEWFRAEQRPQDWDRAAQFAQVPEEFR